MTTLQKTLIGATLAVAVGTGIYQTQQTATARAKSQTLQQQQAGLNAEIEQLRRERDGATAQLVALRDQNETLSRNQIELPRLRGEVARLRREVEDTNRVNRTHLAVGGSQPSGAIALPIPTEAHPLTGRAVVKWDNALLLGNVKMPDGKTAGLFAIPKRGEDDTQLKIDARLVVFPDGFVAPTPEGTPETEAIGVLSPEQSDMLLKAMKDSGAEIRSSPSVIIQSGGQAQIEIAKNDQTPAVFPGHVPSTRDIAAGDDSGVKGQKSVIRVTPNISADGGSVDLVVETWFDTTSSAKANDE